jgi:hypothetical protein
MKAKTVTIIFVTTLLALIWCSAAWAGRSSIRNHRQKQRIRQGIRSNEIIRPEARRLKKEQRRINRAYHRATADGHLSWRERQRLNNMQDRASRHIYRAKHNPVRRRYTVVHNHTVSCYYPGIKTGYDLSVGVSNLGWQFAFSTGDRY